MHLLLNHSDMFFFCYCFGFFVSLNPPTLRSCHVKSLDGVFNGTWKHYVSIIFHLVVFEPYYLQLTNSTLQFPAF